jgi:DNA-binding NtrC family response regulator
VPPLRERKEDIPELVRTFVARFAAEEGRRRLLGVSAEAMALLERYDWPGNVRQLENAMFRAVVLSDGDHLGVEEFPQIAAQVGPVPVDGRRALSIAASTGGVASEAGRAAAATPRIVAGGTAEAPMSGWSPSPSGLAAGSGPAPFGFLRSLDETGHVRDLAAIEEEMIRIAIDHYGGRMTEVARRLGIGRSTLYRKLKEYGLEEATDVEAAE